jgi:heme A synthase
MISLLISLLILLVIFAVVWWILSLVPIPPQFRWIANVVIALIFLVWLISILGGVGGLGFGLTPGLGARHPLW